jgi:hypothetical protein
MDLPFSRGLMKKNNELHSHEHWYRVPKEAQPPKEEQENPIKVQFQPTIAT